MKELRMISAAMLVAALACGTRDKSSASDTAHYGAPPATDSIVAKLPPDTLVNEKGERCVVRPQARFDAIEVGEVGISCGWVR
jgi:hypothetical protein